jgi:phenylalanyl-tRNA synthetase beta subunit
MKLKEPIETEESKTDYKLLRSDLLTPTLRILQENKNADYPQNLFEIGTIFSKAAGGGEALQRSKSVAAQQKTSDTKSPYGGGGGIDTSSETGVKETEQLQITLTPGNFTQAKQHLDALMSSLDLHYDLEEALSEHLAPGRAGIIKVDNAEIGHIGETHPAVLKAWGLKFPIASIAINLDELFKIIS